MDRGNSDSKPNHKKVQAALFQIEFHPDRVRDDLASIEESLRAGILKGRGAASRLSEELEVLDGKRWQVQVVVKSDVQDEVFRIIDGFKKDIESLADEFGVVLGDHTGRLPPDSTDKPRRR
jgi:hypothetical protein